MVQDLLRIVMIVVTCLSTDKEGQGHRTTYVLSQSLVKPNINQNGAQSSVQLKQKGADVQTRYSRPGYHHQHHLTTLQLK